MTAPSQVKGLSTGRYHPSGGLPEGLDPLFVDSSNVTPQASDTEGADNMSNVQMQVAFSSGVHLAQFRGGGDEAVDVHSQQRGAGVWSSSPSAEGPDPDLV